MKSVTNVVNEIIAQSVNTDSILFCIGAGVSFRAGAPTQDRIINALSELTPIGKGGIDDAESFYELATNQLGRNRVVSQIVKLSGNLEPTELHRALAKSSVNIYITTNFDTLLETAIEEENINYKVVVYNDQLPLLEKQKTIVKLAGTIDRPDTLVLTRLDKKTARKSRNKYDIFQDLVRVYLTNNLVIFIGFDLGTELRDFYERFGVESNVLKNWIVLTEKINSPFRSLWSGRGVRLIEVKDSLLVPFVEELSGNISQRKKKTTVKKRIRRVFMSGEAKNIKLRNNIQKLLQEAGLKLVTLNAEPSDGRTLSEKFSALVHEVDAAILIFEEDDRFGFSAGGTIANLLFELGYLVSSLGRENVVVIQSTQQSIQLPFVGSELLIYDSQTPNLFSRQLEDWLSRR